MSKTKKRPYTSSLFHNGEHGPHNTLTREFKGIGGWCIKNTRGLINRRDYESDRLKGIRRIVNKMRRNYLKKEAEKIIESEMYDMV